jgi:hypothetical protein
MGACAGLCYNALWYFPVLIVIGGFATLIWDTWLQQKVGKLKAKWERRRRARNTERTAEEPEPVEMVVPEDTRQGAEGLQRRTPATASKESVSDPGPSNVRSVAGRDSDDTNGNTATGADMTTHAIPIKTGVAIIAAFFSKFSSSSHASCTYYDKSFSS